MNCGPSTTPRVVRAFLTAFALVAGTVSTIVMGLFGVVTGLLPPRGRWSKWGARLWGRMILWECGARLRVEGANRIPADLPVVFVANHESWLDIPALLAAIPVQVRFLAKQSLFAVPFLGWAMWAMGFIPVDRRNRRQAVRSFEAAAARIRSGHSVLIFPEESRSPDGTLQAFQRGGFLIAMKAGVPLVPVGLDGPRRRLAKHCYLLDPGGITVRFGEPLPTAGVALADRELLAEQARERVDALRRSAP